MANVTNILLTRYISTPLSKQGCFILADWVQLATDFLADVVDVLFVKRMSQAIRYICYPSVANRLIRLVIMIIIIEDEAIASSSQIRVCYPLVQEFAKLCRNVPAEGFYDLGRKAIAKSVIKNDKVLGTFPKNSLYIGKLSILQFLYKVEENN